MSWKVMDLVWASGLPIHERIVALRLAHYADEEGRGIYPAAARLAKECGCDERTIRRIAKRLREAEILTTKERPGRTNVHQLDIEALKASSVNYPGQIARPDILSALTECPPTPDNIAAPPLTNRPPTPDKSPTDLSLKESSEPSVKASSPARPAKAELTGEDLQAFQSFWQEYPRKAAKGAARKAFKTALDKASAGDLVQGARRFAEQEAAKRTEAKYIAHPATWLNAERWSDEPDPVATHVPYRNPFA